MYCVNLTQDKDHSSALVNVVMDLRGLHKVLGSS
jgi:hypothetical protein